MFKGKQKLDPILSAGIKIRDIDYKDVDLLSNFLTARGTIVPRRASRLQARTQRAVAKAIKRARMVALLPFDSVSRS
ncbi:MAG: 30S ribosomal protein S18 [Chlamydiia bacterium]|nr:30S ribosomal protein S18 [Chlamydiia bacterium]